MFSHKAAPALLFEARVILGMNSSGVTEICWEKDTQVRAWIFRWSPPEGQPKAGLAPCKPKEGTMPVPCGKKNGTPRKGLMQKACEALNFQLKTRWGRWVGWVFGIP